MHFSLFVASVAFNMSIRIALHQMHVTCQITDCVVFPSVVLEVAGLVNLVLNKIDALLTLTAL
jgi:hypothetical protein